jgi:hypothetical protein
MRTYTILSTDGRSLRVTAGKFYSTLRAKGTDGKSLYWLYDEGQDYVLMPKCDIYRETYRAHHNADSADYQTVDRATRCRDPITGVICKKRCATCEKRDERQGLAFIPLCSEDEDGYMESIIPDTSREANVEGSAERSELLEKLYAVLAELKPLDREIMVRLYGLNGQAVLSKDACATALSVSWHTVDRANTRSLAKLRILLSDYADYDF